MIKNTQLKIGFLLIVFLSAVNLSFGQLKKANKHFLQEEYFAAVTSYKKVLKKDSENKEATQNLAFSYKKLKDYNNAELYYEKATKINPSESANFLYYGQALKNNNKLREAKIQFQKFVAKNPTSLIGKLMVQSCGDIASWEFEEKAYEVENVPNINTKGADFCPLVYEDGIVFVSERGVDLVNGNVNGMSNKPYLSIYYAKKEKEYKKAKHFSNHINSLYHDGPLSISTDKKVIYFCRVSKKEQGKNYTNYLKIYTATLEGKKWKNITPFEYNGADYSVAHPWISENGKQLFFASDMPGGFGGMDIYVCKKTAEGWGMPINLGKHVNTSESEVFPYFRKGKLYFSSEGHSGYGGLDVFVTEQKDNWQRVENLKSPLNSSKDDFGIFYTDDENGYFSSDREGGVGGDDIYSFAWHTLIPQTQVTGLLEYNKLPASGTNINLLDEDDNILQTITTDEEGKFKFEKLDQDRNYILAIDSEDDSYLDGLKMFLTNSNGGKVTEAKRFAKDKFAFQALPYGFYDDMELLNEEDEDVLLTVDINGQVYQKLPGDFSSEIEVWIVDDEGMIIGKRITDKEGKFRFEKLSPDDKYLFMLAEEDSTLNVVILDEKGKIIDAAKRLIDGKYLFNRLSADQNIITLINEVDDEIKISETEVFTAYKVLYEFASAELSKEAELELDKLVLILQKNKHVGVELSSHTDAKGSIPRNMNLSRRRADAAANYLVSKGISLSKITAKGFGEAMPVAPNQINGLDNPKGRAKNRRTEIKVVQLN
ncbi:MAG: OmpA family protein [Vicingaceae bacterium]